MQENVFFHGCINDIFSEVKQLYFTNIEFGYLLEAPHLVGSNEKSNVDSCKAHFSLCSGVYTGAHFMDMIM